MDSDAREEIAMLIAGAEDEVEAAHVLVEVGKRRAALSRAYYAVFYAANALLLTKDIRRSKHAGVQAAFHEFFVKPGLIEIEFGQVYDDARDDRELSDYDMAFVPVHDAAKSRLADAQRFVARVKAYLFDEGVL